MGETYPYVSSERNAFLPITYIFPHSSENTQDARNMETAVTEFQRRFHISVDDEAARREDGNTNNSAQVRTADACATNYGFFAYSCRVFLGMLITIAE